MATAASAPTAISAASVRSANAKSRYSSTPGNVEVVELADPGPGKRRAAVVPLVTHAWTGKETEQTAFVRGACRGVRFTPPLRPGVSVGLAPVRGKMSRRERKSEQRGRGDRRGYRRRVGS